MQNVKFVHVVVAHELLKCLDNFDATPDFIEDAEGVPHGPFVEKRVKSGPLHEKLDHIDHIESGHSW